MTLFNNALNMFESMILQVEYPTDWWLPEKAQ